MQACLRLKGWQRDENKRQDKHQWKADQRQQALDKGLGSIRRARRAHDDILIPEDDAENRDEQKTDLQRNEDRIMDVLLT